MADVTSVGTTVSDLNEVLINIADQLGMDIIVLIAFLAIFIALLLIILVGLIRRPSESPIIITTVSGESRDKNFKYVERTLVEFPAETVRIEIARGKLVVKLIEAKPRTTTPEKKTEAPPEAKEGEAKSG